MKRTIVFLHGAWMTSRCWDPFVSFFEAKGYACVAPSWPYKDRTIDELRQHPDPRLATIGVAEIVAHYERVIRGLQAPPVLIGHSFGGLFVQMLLDRGLGVAGVAINPAPPKGVLSFYWSTFRSLSGVLCTPMGWRRVVRWSFEEFRYAFVHTLSPAAQRAAYETYVTPETGRVFFQAALAPFHDVTRVHFMNATRAPLLLIAGSADHICTAAQIRSNYHQYRRTTAVTQFREFPGRTHWIIAQDGWEEVAGSIAGWLDETLH